MTESDAEQPPPQAIPVNFEGLLASRMEKIEETQTIYSVLPSIRAEDNGAYNPMIVSIGPFHQNNKELLLMQQLNWQLLHDLIRRSSTMSLDNYINVARLLKSRAGNCYSGHVEQEGDEFEEMLVLDVCFIIEFLVNWIPEEKYGTLYVVHWILPQLRNDLLLLENQLPVFVLKSLFEASVIPDLDDFKMGKDSLNWLALSYFTRVEMDIPSIPYNFSHLLQLFHLTLRPTLDGQDKSNTVSCLMYVMILTRKIKHVLLYSIYWCRRPPGLGSCTRAPRMVPSVNELQEAGVQFKAQEKARGLLDVMFNNGVLEILMLSIKVVTIPLFRNLVALEQCSPGSRSDFTSYVALMVDLIDTSNDVLVLEGCWILESKLGGEEEVAKLFNSLCMGTYLEYDKHHLRELFSEVEKYSATESNQWRARLVHDSFGKPWSINSLIATIMLLVLTTVQTLLGVLPYFDSPTGNALSSPSERVDTVCV